MLISCQIGDEPTKNYLAMRAANPHIPKGMMIEQCIMVTSLLSVAIDDPDSKVVVSGPGFYDELVRSKTGLIVPKQVADRHEN